ncbi:MAG: THUMP domain-containing class I SAM-dependent RNA methyltransferase [Betaproteobacteria bacterium]
MERQAELIATAAFGLESLVASEVRRLGYSRIRVENGRVTFTGDLSAIPRANLWLRAADRVLVKMGTFPAPDFDALFEGTLALPWAEWLPGDAAFPVLGKSVRSALHSVPAVQSVVKKAIVEHLRRETHQVNLPECGPAYPIFVSLLKDVATLTLDTTGPGLHKRGYRRQAGPAPLKETLAAGLLLLSRWRPDRPLVDPCCGSGTIPIEAALLGRNIAPGLNRCFTAEAWPQLPPALWQTAREEARDLIDRTVALDIKGYDLHPGAVGLARRHAEEAGVATDLAFAVQDMAELRLPPGPGFVVCNPPYGERLGEVAEAEALYQVLGRLSQAAPGWSFFVLTAHPAFERLFGRQADRARKLYNGRLECQYLQFFRDASQFGRHMV